MYLPLIPDESFMDRGYVLHPSHLSLYQEMGEGCGKHLGLKKEIVCFL